MTRVDWFRVIVDLERRFGSTAAVAAKAGIPRETLASWRLGMVIDPRYRAGDALARMWREAMEKTELPTVVDTPSVARVR